MHPDFTDHLKRATTLLHRQGYNGDAEQEAARILRKGVILTSDLRKLYGVATSTATKLMRDDIPGAYKVGGEWFATPEEALWLDR